MQVLLKLTRWIIFYSMVSSRGLDSSLINKREWFLTIHGAGKGVSQNKFNSVPLETSNRGFDFVKWLILIVTPNWPRFNANIEAWTIWRSKDLLSVYVTATMIWATMIFDLKTRLLCWFLEGKPMNAYLRLILYCPSNWFYVLCSRLKRTEMFIDENDV